jgi:hypothetical protein
LEKVDKLGEKGETQTPLMDTGSGGVVEDVGEEL